MTTAPSLLDHLMNAGYEPDDDAPGSTLWADLVVSGIGTVRCIIDGPDTNVHAFDQFMVEDWSARFTGAPDAAVIATLETAEWELAARRGGPVTPAQAATAR
jgi:hypothetical protein